MINKKKALDDFQISEKDYDEMLVEFVAQANETIVQIEKTIHDGKIEEAERFAHSLKGVAGNLRLDNCFKIASTADNELKKGLPASIAPLLDELKKAVTEVESSITCR